MLYSAATDVPSVAVPTVSVPPTEALLLTETLSSVEAPAVNPANVVAPVTSKVLDNVAAPVTPRVLESVVAPVTPRVL